MLRRRFDNLEIGLRLLGRRAYVPLVVLLVPAPNYGGHNPKRSQVKQSAKDTPHQIDTGNQDDACIACPHVYQVKHELLITA